MPAVSCAVVSESQDDAAPEGSERRPAEQDAAAEPSNRARGDKRDREQGGSEARKLSRRGWTVLLSAILVLVFVLLGMFVRVPYVVLGPGPTYNTIGEVDGAKVIKVDGRETYPTKGELRMTTVSFSDEVTLFGALGMWISGRYALAPREAYFEEGQTDKEFRQHSQKLFRRSQSKAELAAFHHLGYPTKVLIGRVMPNTPAASQAAGQLAKGEQLVAVNGKEIGSIKDVHEALASTEPGQTIPVTVLSEDGSEKREISITLGRRAGSKPPEPLIGVTLAERAAVPFTVDVTLDEVGGPSAGMMFALGIIDRLTPGALTGGKAVAGTGTIERTGEVGPIGGISFKLVAAREAGAQAFLVPAKNCAAAAATAPEGLRLIKVDNLGDAVSALKNLAAGRPTPTC